MKILVCGDRNWTDKKFIFEVLDKHSPSEIIEGEARGADTIAKLYALEHKLILSSFPAEWNRFGRSAGPIRNRQMLKANPELVIAFHDRLDTSKGTKDMVFLAKRNGIPVELYSHSEEK